MRRRSYVHGSVWSIRLLSSIMYLISYVNYVPVKAGAKLRLEIATRQEIQHETFGLITWMC